MKVEFSEIQTIVTKNSIIYNRYLKRCPNLPGPQGRRSWYQEDNEFGEENINPTEISLNFFSFLTLKYTLYNDFEVGNKNCKTIYSNFNFKCAWSLKGVVTFRGVSCLHILNWECTMIGDQNIWMNQIFPVTYSKY